MRFGDIDNTSNTSYVASLELSRTLYELTQWDDVEWYVDAGGRPVCPQYSLGFLLRKLPQFMLYRHADTYYMNNITMDIRGPGLQSSFDAQSDTPENAAAKLCIQLIKAKVLTP